VVDALAHFSWKSLVSTLYTAGLASLLGYAVFNGLLARYTPAAVVPWVLVAPVVAMLSAWLLLAQRPNVGEASGGAVLLIGVLVALRPPAQKVLTRGAERTVATASAGWGRANR
jgi:O-acetylserine/cysteine efflux transporter